MKRQDCNQEYLKEIKSQLRYGDYQIISKIVDCSPELVKKVFRGERRHKKGKGKKVVEIARKIIETRKSLEELGGIW